MGFPSILGSLVRTETHNVALLLFEFEELFFVAVGFVVVLMYLFYVKYPYNRDTD